MLRLERLCSTKGKKHSRECISGECGMRSFLFPIMLLSATVCLSQNQDNAQTPPYEKAVQWVDIHVPTFPAIARTARILGTVAIEVRFKGCELDPESPHVVSGHR